MKKKRKLIRQLFPSYLLITVISLVAVAWYASDSLKHFFLKQTAADLKARAHLLEMQLGRYLSPVDTISIDSLCKKLGACSATRFTVILPSGRVVGDSEKEPSKMDNHGDRPEVRNAFVGDVGIATRHSRTLKKRMMYVAVPLKTHEKVIGVIRAAISVTSIDEELHGVQIRIAFGGLLIALLAAGISLLISRRISRPIEAMKQGAQRFADGDLRYRLLAPDSKELEDLALAMNRMAEQLDDRINTVIRQRNELEAVLSSMMEGVVALDTEERILNLNQAAARMFGLDSFKTQGRSIQEVIRNSELQQFVKQALSDREPTEDEIFLHHKKERILHIHSTPLYEAEGKHIGILVVLYDITRLKRLENMRRDFVANVSHEIKTPLTAIQGFVETLQNGALANPEETKRFLDIIEKHVNRLNAVIEDLLSLSRLEQEEDKKEIKLEKGHIYDVVQAAVQICAAKAAAKNIKIDLTGDEALKADMDPPLLEQAVVNLLDNAIQYSPEKSAVRIAVIPQEPETLIRVQDQGAGIAKEHLPRLFERFYRADKARSRELGGTGLGLAIAKHIVQAHNGHITVESTPEKGSTFTIHLPQ